MRSYFINLLLCTIFKAAVGESDLQPWRGSTVDDLHAEYGNIFKFGNRNAASHRWSAFIIQRAAHLNLETVETMFTGFCSVSGSIVRPSDYARYRLRLPTVTGGIATGFMYYCCWPCVCDTQDFIRVDTLTLVTLEGRQTLHVAVIGNPCDHPEKLREPFVQPFGGYTTTLEREAAEVRCTPDGALEGASRSDHGYPIISMFFNAVVESNRTAAVVPLSTPQPGRLTEDNGITFQDEFEYAHLCEERKNNGYNSGMGEIFRKVAAISMLSSASTDQPAGYLENSNRNEL
jgi:hypothetical protein